MELLKIAFDHLNIRYTAKELTSFAIYLRMLKKWSRVYNLTSLRTDRDIMIKHFVDSLGYLTALPEDTLTLLDIGSGAGFPGIPLKIVRPRLEVYLLEPSRKKVSFLKNLVKTLALPGVHVVRCRVENYPCNEKNLPQGFDVVVTRALFKVKDFYVKSSPLCNRTGKMIISKGPLFQNELAGMNANKYEVVKADLLEFGLERNLLVMSP